MRQGRSMIVIIGNEVIQNILIKSVFDKLLKMKIVSVSQVTQSVSVYLLVSSIITLPLAPGGYLKLLTLAY